MVSRPEASKRADEISKKGADKGARAARADIVARHFKFFLVAAEAQSFQRAAERLNIAQSALSRRISDMEREIGGVALFERFARGVRLTESGQSMLDDVRRIMTEIEEACHKAWRIDRGEVGLLRIGFADTTGWKRLIPELLRRFEAEYPEVEVQLLPMVSELQRGALRSGAIEIGFMFRELGDMHGDEDELRTIPLARHRFVLVVPKNHLLNSRLEITLSDLKGENLIWPSRRHAPLLFNQMVDACRSRNFVPRIKTEVVTIDMGYHLVSAGLGLAMILAEDDADPPPGLVLKRLADFRLDMHLTMSSRRDDNTPALSNFLDMAERILGSTAA